MTMVVFDSKRHFEWCKITFLRAEQKLLLRICDEANNRMFLKKINKKALINMEIESEKESGR